MNTRVFNNAERAVIMAIDEQGKLYPDVPFAYSIKEGQLYINNLGVRVDRTEHMEIIRRLAREEIIDADWLVPPKNNSNNSDLTICSFARHRDWAEKHFVTSQLVPSNMKYDDYYYIKVHPRKIQAIIDTFTVMGTANIFPANDPLSLEIHCATKKGREVFVIHVFDDEKRPYKIVSYVLEESKKRPGVAIGRGELSKKIRDSKGEELIKPDANIKKIFSNNTVIKEILSSFIELYPDSILINKDVKLYRPLYETIKAKARRATIIQ